ncbi:hypothetical protein Tco_0794128 [Tanacetum coccineum]
MNDSEDVDVVQRGPVRDEGRGAGGSGGASGSRGRGAGGSKGRGAGGSKRKPVSTAETQKRQGKKKTQHKPEQTQVVDQVVQTQDQAEIDLTQLEQTQKPTQDQVHPQEQPQQAALRMSSARILQRTLEKQGSRHRYVVPTGRVVVLTGRYVVPAGKVIIIVSPGKLSLVPTGRVLSPGRVK